MSTVATAATAVRTGQRTQRRPRANASENPRNRNRPKRCLIDRLPMEVLDLIGSYIYAPPSLYRESPFPSSYNSNELLLEDKHSLLGGHGSIGLASPKGWRDLMRLSRTCKALRDALAHTLASVGGMRVESHMAALQESVDHVRYLYINQLGTSSVFSKQFKALLAKSAQVREIVIKSCVHHSAVDYIPSHSHLKPGGGLPPGILPQLHSLTLGNEVCRDCSHCVLSLLGVKGASKLKHLRLAMPLPKVERPPDQHFWIPHRRRVPEPQNAVLLSLLNVLHNEVRSEVQTFHLELRCNKDQWGGLVSTGSTSNDVTTPRPRSNKSKSIPGLDDVSMNSTNDASGDSEYTDSDQHTGSSSATPPADVAPAVTAEAALPVDAAARAAQRRLQKYIRIGNQQRLVMLTEQQDINKCIAAAFPKLQELKSWRAGPVRTELMKETNDLELYVEAFVDPLDALPNIKTIDFSIVLSTYLASRLASLQPKLSPKEFADKAKEAQDDLDEWREVVMRRFLFGESCDSQPAKKPATDPQEVKPKIQEQKPIPPPLVVPPIPRAPKDFAAAAAAILAAIAAMPQRSMGPPAMLPLPARRAITLQAYSLPYLSHWPDSVISGRWWAPNLDLLLREKGRIHAIDWQAMPVQSSVDDDDMKDLREAERHGDERRRAGLRTVTIMPEMTRRF